MASVKNHPEINELHFLILIKLSVIIRKTAQKAELKIDVA
jgi:hypothetical protein